MHGTGQRIIADSFEAKYGAAYDRACRAAELRATPGYLPGRRPLRPRCRQCFGTGHYDTCENGIVSAGILCPLCSPPSTRRLSDERIRRRMAARP
jgi:hypothetical protein